MVAKDLFYKVLRSLKYLQQNYHHVDKSKDVCPVCPSLQFR